MTSAFEFGAGEQFGNDFVSDQDGLTFFELRKEASDTQTVTASANDKVVFTKMFGDGLRSSLMASKTDLTHPEAGLYHHRVSLEVTSAGGAGFAEVTLVSSDGSIYQLGKVATGTTAVTVGGSVYVPVIAAGSPPTLPTFSVKLAATTHDVAITLGNDSTTRKSVWQVMQVPVVKAPSKLQVLPS